MTSPRQYQLGTALIAVVITSTLAISGCSTGFNTWTPETGNTVDAYLERSCASGYYDCATGSRGGRGGGGEGSAK
jgi:hypothetical protein